jgi:hypothetical protein
MILDRITITGADDTTDISALLDISREFSCVEWAVLYSRHEGRPRFPSAAWREKLLTAATGFAVPSNLDVQLSAHLCGGYVRALLLGEPVRGDWQRPEFARVQLNFHGEQPTYAFSAFQAALRDRPALRGQSWIFQIDGVNDFLFEETLTLAAIAPMDHLPPEHEAVGPMLATARAGIEVVPLFDASHGAGVSPNAWPAARYRDAEDRLLYHGYAGGLGPENIADELGKIAAAAGDARVWIDMETRVRTDDLAALDLGKVRSVLKAAAAFMDHGVVAGKSACTCEMCHGEGLVGSDGTTCDCIKFGCKGTHKRDAYMPSAPVKTASVREVGTRREKKIK